MTTIHNPILTGFHPDPCFCAARGKYYLATSTFQWLPGVSLYESDDLATWRSVGGALTGLDLRGIPDSAGVWAPDLTFDGERFWLVYTVSKQIDGIFKDVENYVVTATDIEGPWSEPIFINASGFDPGMYHEDGRHYVLNPQWDPRPLPGHHRFNGLILQEFTLDGTGRADGRPGLIGEARKVLGNEDAVNWLREGPHIMAHDGWHYIACAEGGTGRRHRIRMARSHELWGPYEVCPEPLVCAWCSDAPLRKAGHGNFVQGPDGSWYVCHLTARYLPNRDGSPHVFDEHENGISPLGRETAMQRVVWEDGWPRLAAGGIAPQLTVDVPNGARPQSGHAYETAFAAATDLAREEWLAPRRQPTADAGWFHLGAQPDGTGIELVGGDSPSSLFDRASLSRRVTSFAYHAEAELSSFAPHHYNQTAGLIVEYDARAFRYLNVGWDEERSRRVIDVIANDNGEFTMPAHRVEVPADVQRIVLSVDVHDYDLRFSYAFDDGEPLPVFDAQTDEPLVSDASVMSDELVHGWTYTGTMVGITCVDMFDKTTAATFARFAYADVPADAA